MGRCARCNGWTYVERDVYGMRVTCLTCGRGLEVRAESRPGRAEAAVEGPAPCPRCEAMLPRKISSWLYCTSCGPLARQPVPIGKAAG